MEYFKIKPDYKLHQWHGQYRDQENFAESVQILQNFEQITELEAEEKLLDILGKATFIEKCLQYKGCMRARDLLVFMYNTAEEFKRSCPFSSEKELEDFLATSDSLFIKHHRKQEYRNSGAGFRKFVQLLRRKLENGDIINESNLDAVLKEHYDSIAVGGDNLRFLKKEVHVEFQSLEYLPKQVACFKYDSETETLTLEPSAAQHWPLRLPIFTNLLSTGKLDCSRTISGYMRPYKYAFPDVINGLVISPPFDGAIVNFRKKKFQRGPDHLLQSAEMFFVGAIVAESLCSQIEVFRLFPITKGLQDGLWAPQALSNSSSNTSNKSFPQKLNEIRFWQDEIFEMSPESIFDN